MTKSPSFSRTWIALALSLLTLSLLTLRANAQQPASAPPTLKVTTNLTIEDVTVADGKGNAIYGLTQSDFTILEDGKPQPIRHFEEYGRGQPVSSALNILMLDEVTASIVMNLANGMYAQDESVVYLKKMPPGTIMAVFMLGDGLQVIQGPTTDRNLLVNAVNSVIYQPIPGAYVIPSPPARGTAFAGAQSSRNEFCLAANRQSELVLNSLAQAAAMLARLPGRKNLIWLTRGIPWLTNYFQYIAMGCFNNYTPQLRKVYDMLAAAHVALYPIDPKGVGPCDDMCDSQKDLAERTGGVASGGRNDVDAAIGDAVTNGAHYYSISYVPPPVKYDGQFHTIDVKINKPGLHLNYRKGYTAATLDKPNSPPRRAKNQH